MRLGVPATREYRCVAPNCLAQSGPCNEESLRLAQDSYVCAQHPTDPRIFQFPHASGQRHHCLILKVLNVHLSDLKKSLNGVI